MSDCDLRWAVLMGLRDLEEKCHRVSPDTSARAGLSGMLRAIVFFPGIQIQPARLFAVILRLSGPWRGLKLFFATLPGLAKR